MNRNKVIDKIDRLNSENWEKSINAPAASLDSAEETCRLAESANYQKGIADSLLNSGRCRIFLSDLDKSETDLKRALEIYRTIGGREAVNGEIRTLNNLGIRAHYSADYENSLNYFFMALSLNNVCDDLDARIRILNNIGEIHNAIYNIEEALTYYHRAAGVAGPEGHEKLRSVVEVNLGLTYLKLKDVEIARRHLKRALELSTDFNYLPVEADAKLGFARIELMGSDPKAAEDGINQAMIIYEKTSDMRGVGECWYRLGQLRLIEGKLDEGEKFIDSALKLAAEEASKELKRRCCRRKSQIYKKRGESEQALLYFEKFYEIERALRNDKLKNRLKKITILYETEQTEAEKESYRIQSLKLEKINKEIGFINEIGREITSSLELEKIIHSTYKGLSKLFDVSLFGIAILDDKTTVLDFRYFYNKGEKVKPFKINLDSKKSLSVWSIQNHEPLLIRNIDEFYDYVDELNLIDDETTQSAIFLPILHCGKLIGCLTIQSDFKNAYDEHHLEILGAISSFIAIALDNSNAHHELNKLNQIIMTEKQGLEDAYKKIAHMANHDPLTDLPNRHLLNELLGRGIRAAKRERSRLAVFYMDLDMFKPINDTLGHGAGDLVLRIIGERLCSTLRSSDTIARIGGDEFVAVLYNCETEEGIMSAAEKVIEAVGKDLMLLNNKFNIGVSIGIACYPEDGESIDDLLLKADNAMYEAKRNGKNTAVFASSFADKK